MSVRSRDALCAPNPLQVHAHTTLQGTLFWVYASLTFSRVLRGAPGTRTALRALRARTPHKRRSGFCDERRARRG